MIYSLAPRGSWYATERQNGCFWLGDCTCWTSKSEREREREREKGRGGGGGGEGEGESVDSVSRDGADTPIKPQM